METIIKAVLIAIICCAAVVIISRYIPEYAPFAQIAAVIAVLVSVTGILENTVSYFTDFISSGVMDSAYAVIVLKAVFVAAAAQFGAELCRDCGNSALAFSLETAAKIIILSMSLPMLKNLADITAGLLKG